MNKSFEIISLMPRKIHSFVDGNNKNQLNNKISLLKYILNASGKNLQGQKKSQNVEGDDMQELIEDAIEVQFRCGKRT